MRELLSGPGRTVERTRERRDSRIEGALTFDSPSALCGAPLLRRECRFQRTAEGGFELSMKISVPTGSPGGPTTGPTGTDAPPAVEIRIQTEGRILEHNSEGPIGRGNVLAWKRTPDLADLGDDGTLRVVADGTSVFAYTARTVGRSALIALLITAAGLWLVVAEGRRRLAREKGR